MAEPPVKSTEDQFTTAFPRDGLVPLESILCTEELNQRAARPPDYEAENRALVSLAQALSESPRTILQSLADKILEVFQAGSAGLSLLTKEDGGKRFYWPAIAGVWKPHIGGGTPREFGPCGDVLDRNVPLLFRHFEWRYPYLLPVTPPAEECLLVPFYVEGKAVGTIWAIAHDDRRKFDLEDLRQLVSLGTFASSAYQVTALLDALDQQGETLRQSEERLRDLYEEAPIAYVKEDLESRFISANRAAQRILGIKPEEVPGFVGLSLVPDRPDAQRAAHELFSLQVRGKEPRGVVVELRRKDNGKAVWIEIWAKPEPGGKYTRTMFLDVTDRVLMEREKARLAAENVYLQEEIKSVHNFEEIVGQSPALLEALEKVSRVAKTDATVLIAGETGTGKELIARAIHSASKRHDKPLIKVNCAALPAGLVESELFGHEKGAFSGAINRGVGRFELAHGGTIFLDEIGEVPIDVQVKLLRVLQEREFERVGGTKAIHVDVRVIAATNRDLGKSIREGKFRDDLFYRLNVFPIPLPPLRNREGDVPLLVHFLVDRFAAGTGVRIKSVGKVTMERLNH